MDVQKLLTPSSPETPCGSNLEHSLDFMALHRAATGQPERQMGDTMVRAEEPKWPEIAVQALSLLAQTKDLRVAILLVRALAHTQGVKGLAAGLQLIQGLLAAYWQDVHPCLDPLENNDPTERLNVLRALTDSQAVVGDVWSINLLPLEKKPGLTVKEILVIQKKLPVSTKISDSQTATLSRTDAQEILLAAPPLQEIAALRDALQALDQIDLILNAKVGGECAPDFQPLKDPLQSVLAFCDSVLPTETLSQEVTAAQSAAKIVEQALQKSSLVTDGSVEADAQQTASKMHIHNREDALKMLEQVCVYLENTEPSHPAPLFIRRAQRLMRKNFIEILQDLAPDSLNQIQHMAGIEAEAVSV